LTRASDLFEAAGCVLVQQARDQRLVRQAFRQRPLLDRLQVLARQADVQPSILLERRLCVRSPTMKIDPDEKQLLESVDFMPVLASPLALQTAAFNLSATSPRRESKSIYDVVG
jgi:hypothetical protein